MTHARLLSLVLVAVGCVSARGDWPQFRGPNSAGVAGNDPVPVEFGPGKNERWRIPLGSGHSSPCVAGDAIFLTTFDKASRELAVVCIARADGKQRWRKVIPTEGIEKGHPSFNPASSSPASDGERVVAYFGSYGLICFDMQGKKLWDVRMPVTRSYAGNATSPAIVGERVILYRGNYVDHFLLAVHKRTGKQLWRVPQAEAFTGEMACTACPIAVGDKLIVHTARSVQAFQVATGQRLWVAKCATTATSTPVVAGKEVLVAAWNKMGEPSLRPKFPTYGELLAKHDGDRDGQIRAKELPRLWIFHRPEGAEAPQNGATVRFQHVDRNKNGQISADEWSSYVRRVEAFRQGYDSHGLLAIRLDSQGFVNASAVRKLETVGIPEVPSPLCDGRYVYFVKNGGVLTCVDLKTGKRVYRRRTGGRGTHYASPLIADGKLFSFAGNGRVSVLTLGPQPKLLATNEMRDAVYATPAIVDGTIYLRTHKALFAFGVRKDLSRNENR